MKHKKHNYIVYLYLRLSKEIQLNNRRIDIQELENKVETANKIMTEFMIELQKPFYRRKIILKN